MRTTPTRTALVALALLGSCAFDRITDGAIEIDVTGMPEAAVRAELVITDANNSTLKREPHFGTGVYQNAVLTLTVPAVSAGHFTAQVTAYDIDDTPLAVGNGAGTYVVATGPDQPLVTVAVQLSSNGLQGTYGTPCILTGTGSNTCSGGLVCKQYSTADQGVCTHSCTGNSACETPPPGVTCEAFAGVAANTFCQWECGTDGGTCPPSLSCGQPVASSGGKRFCQGTP